MISYMLKFFFIFYFLFFINDGMCTENKEEKILLNEKNKIKIYNQKNVIIKNKQFNVKWIINKHKYDTSFIYIKNCENVTIDQIVINQMNEDYRSSYSILIEDCKNVYIKNSTFSGTTEYHLRIEGAKNINIDNIEIYGRNYNFKGNFSGGGIWVNNGDSFMESGGVWSSKPYDLMSLIIQNCYIHDNDQSVDKRNLDGILIHSASTGYLRNNRFERWKGGDAALDVSHRRTDSRYTDKVFNVYGNSFVDCEYVKSVGHSRPSNRIVWFDNVYNNTTIADYHVGYDIFHFNEKIYSNKLSCLFKNWGIADGITYFINCLFVSEISLVTVFGLGKNLNYENVRNLFTNCNYYVMPKPKYFMVNGYTWSVVIPNFVNWQKENFDINSKFIEINMNENLNFSYKNIIDDYEFNFKGNFSIYDNSFFIENSKFLNCNNTSNFDKR